MHWEFKGLRKWRRQLPLWLCGLLCLGTACRFEVTEDPQEHVGVPGEPEPSPEPPPEPSPEPSPEPLTCEEALTGLPKARSQLAKQLGVEHLLVGIMTAGNRARYEEAIEGVPYGLKYIYLSERANPGGPREVCDNVDFSWWGCWNEGSGTRPGGRLRNLFTSTEAAGQIPMVVYYTFYRTIGEGALTPAMLLNTDNKVRDYFDDWRFVLQVVDEYQQASGKPVMLHIEPDLWGYAQQSAAGRPGPAHLPIEVRSTTRGDCSTLEDNFAGFGQCMLHMARTYAPKASVGLMASGWATGVDINLSTHPQLEVDNIAQQTGAYLNHFRLGEDLGDFLVVEFSDRDAGYYEERPAHEGGPENRWYHEEEGPFPSFPRTFRWAKTLAETVQLPLVWWQIPMGHMGLENQNLPNNSGQWKDNRAEYLFRPSSLQTVVHNHGMALAFGPGQANQTSPTTDGGFLAAKLRAYAQNPQPLLLECQPPPPPPPPPLPCEAFVMPQGTPQRLVSLGKPTVASTAGGNAPMLVDGKFRDAAAWAAQVGDWASIEVGEGPTELLLQWTASANTDHPEIRYGAPASYRVETSADSTTGRPEDGTWTEVLTVTDNPVRTRVHRIPFAGQRWVRFVVLSKEGTGPEVQGVDGIRIDEVELVDNSDGKADAWFFLGDSITAGAFTRESSQNPAFATYLWAATGHYPLQMNGGYGGDTARNPALWGGTRQHSLQRLQQALEENDGIRVVALALGTNDFGDIAGYRTAMRALVEEVQRRGKTAIIPRIPWSAEAGRPEATQEAMNEVVDALTREYGLPQGPDLYAHFKANPHHLRGEEVPSWSNPDWLHPNAAGNKAMNCLWAEAVLAAKVLD